MKFKLANIFLFSLLTLFINSAVYAQIDDEPDDKVEDIQTESIEVVKLYEPILAKAKKIGISPKGVQNETKTPIYTDYLVPNKFLTLAFEPPKLKPLALKKERPEPLHNFWLKAGFGNYWTPFVDLSYSSARPNDNIFGINLKHHSSRISGDYPKDFMVNDGLVYGRFLGKSVSFDVDAGYEHDRFFYYGYNQLDSTDIPLRDDISLVYQNIPIDVKIANSQENNANFNYEAKVHYHHFWSNRQVREDNIAFNAEVYKDNNDGLGFGTDLYLDYTTFTDSLQIGQNSRNTFAFNAKPNIYFKKAFGIVRAGASLIVDQDEFVPFPFIDLEINVIEKYLTAYGGWSKDIAMVNYKNQTDRNPFLGQIQEFDNTVTESRFLGVKGNVGSSLTFDLNGGQYLIKNLPLFVNQAFDTKQFSLVYDSLITKIGASLSLNYMISSRSNIHLTGSYYNYNTTEKVKNSSAWHISPININLGTKFAITDRINVGADVLFFGKRTARLENGSEVKLKEIIDLNLSIDYQLAKKLYLFAEVNNIASANYQQYLNYPSYGINFLGGLILRY